MDVLEELPFDIIGGRQLLAIFEHEKECPCVFFSNLSESWVALLLLC